MSANIPTKSSINILQEFCVVQHKQNPNYIIKDVSPSVHSPRFEVTVEVGKVSCSAQGCNKKQAKDACARLALEELGLLRETEICTKRDIMIDETDSSTAGEVTYNAIGALNEYSAQNRLPYAIYRDVGTNEKGLIILECKLGEVVSHGLGANKKIAKQLAADAALKKLKSLKSNADPNCPTPMKIQRLTSDQVDSTTLSARASPISICTSTKIKIEEIGDEKPTEDITESPVKQQLDNHVNEESKEGPPISEQNTEIPERTQLQNEEQIKDEDVLLEEFRLKLSELGIQNDTNLKIKENVNSRIVTYRNDDLNFNIVKISYNLNKTLNDIFDNIKERYQA